MCQNLEYLKNLGDGDSAKNRYYNIALGAFNLGLKDIVV